MRHIRFSIVGIAASCSLFFCLAPRAVAQCSMGSDFNGIALRTGSPFQAEKTTTFTHETQAQLAPPEHPPELVARDSQGRVRIEMTGGKFKVEEGEGAGTEDVRRIVTLCDPVSGKLVHLDTISKTATIETRGPLSQRVPSQSQVATQMQRPFCPTFAPVQSVGNVQREDLGHQSIEGFDAQGVRTTRPQHALLNGEGTASSFITEAWCSEELGVMLTKITQAGGSSQTRTEQKLTKIVPGEPDPALFQIPPDYRIVERVPEEHKPGQMRTLGSVSTAPLPTPAEASPQ